MFLGMGGIIGRGGLVECWLAQSARQYHVSRFSTRNSLGRNFALSRSNPMLTCSTARLSEIWGGGGGGVVLKFGCSCGMISDSCSIFPHITRQACNFAVEIITKGIYREVWRCDCLGYV